MVLMAPVDEVELMASLKLGLSLDTACAIRFPRDMVPAPIPDCPRFVLGRSRCLREGDDATILCYGTVAHDALASRHPFSGVAREERIPCRRSWKTSNIR